MRVEVELISTSGKTVVGFVHINEMLQWLNVPVISLRILEEYGLSDEIYIENRRYWCDFECRAIRGGCSPRKVSFRVARVNFTDDCLGII